MYQLVVKKNFDKNEGGLESLITSDVCQISSKFRSGRLKGSVLMERLVKESVKVTEKIALGETHEERTETLPELPHD